MKACEFESQSELSMDDIRRYLPQSINLAQSQIGYKNEPNDIFGDVGDGALPYFVDIYCTDSSLYPTNIKILSSLFSDYKRPGITREYLSKLFYIYKLDKDYGAQALSPEYVDFAVSCYNEKGEKINHIYTAILRELRSREAFVLISKDILSLGETNNITIRISYKINNNNPKAILLTKKDNYYYYDPDENDDLHELSILANADSYCFYAEITETTAEKTDTSNDSNNKKYYYLPNSFNFNIDEVENTSEIVAAPQTGNKLNDEDHRTNESKYNVIVDDNKDDDSDNDNASSKIYLTENGKNVMTMIFPDITTDDVNYIRESDVPVSSSSSTSKLMFSANDINMVADYFRQLYDSKKKESELSDKYSTPTTMDKYVIKFYPLIKLPENADIYLGTRYLEENAFFYDPENNKLNGKLKNFNCDFSESADDKEGNHSDSAEDSKFYRFNSMDQFEVYEFADKTSPFGTKIPVEDDKLYDTNNKPKLFDEKSNIIETYEIVPRYDNQMFASISFKNTGNGTIKDVINDCSIFNYTKGVLYIFVDGSLLYSISIIDGNLVMPNFDTNLSNITGTVIEICLHIPYEKETTKGDNYSKPKISFDGYYYNDKNIFRDGYCINKHDIGLNVSADISESSELDTTKYIYLSTEPVAYRDTDPVIVVNDKADDMVDGEKIFDIIPNSKISYTHFDFNRLYTDIENNIKNINTDINDNKSNTLKNIIDFENNYRNFFINGYRDLFLNSTKTTEININNIAYIKIDKTEITYPLYVYSNDGSVDNPDYIVDIIYPENYGDTHMLKNTTLDNYNNCYYYIPIYLYDTTGSNIWFKDKDGNTITITTDDNAAITVFNKQDIDNYWTPITGG